MHTVSRQDVWDINQTCVPACLIFDKTVRCHSPVSLCLHVDTSHPPLQAEPHGITFFTRHQHVPPTLSLQHKTHRNACTCAGACALVYPSSFIMLMCTREDRPLTLPCWLVESTHRSYEATSYFSLHYDGNIRVCVWALLVVSHSVCLLLGCMLELRRRRRRRRGLATRRPTAAVKFVKQIPPSPPRHDSLRRGKDTRM